MLNSLGLMTTGMAVYSGLTIEHKDNRREGKEIFIISSRRTLFLHSATEQNGCENRLLLRNIQHTQCLEK